LPEREKASAERKNRLGLSFLLYGVRTSKHRSKTKPFRRTYRILSIRSIHLHTAIIEPSTHPSRINGINRDRRRRLRTVLIYQSTQRRRRRRSLRKEEEQPEDEEDHYLIVPVREVGLEGTSGRVIGITPENSGDGKESPPGPNAVTTQKYVTPSVSVLVGLETSVKVRIAVEAKVAIVA
jgi:hypothetical protein